MHCVRTICFLVVVGLACFCFFLSSLFWLAFCFYIPRAVAFFWRGCLALMGLLGYDEKKQEKYELYDTENVRTTRRYSDVDRGSWTPRRTVIVASGRCERVFWSNSTRHRCLVLPLCNYPELLLFPSSADFKPAPRSQRVRSDGRIAGSLRIAQPWWFSAAGNVPTE